MPVRITQHSIKGRKPSQEDALLVLNDYNGTLILVADGVGGHGHGDFASQHCVSVFETAFTQEHFELEIDFLSRTAKRVAREVYAKGQADLEFARAGTTLTGFLVYASTFYWINIGDSRVYRLDLNGELQQVTKDHSLVQRLIDQGELTAEAARQHPQRNVMYSAIGQPPEEVVIDVAKASEDLQAGELLLACSDGVNDALTDAEIQSILRQNRENPELSRILVEAAFDAGGKDNITACTYLHA